MNSESGERKSIDGVTLLAAAFDQEIQANNEQKSTENHPGGLPRGIRALSLRTVFRQRVDHDPSTPNHADAAEDKIPHVSLPECGTGGSVLQVGLSLRSPTRPLATWFRRASQSLSPTYG